MQLEKEIEAFDSFKALDFKTAEKIFRELDDKAPASGIKLNRRQNLANCLAAQGKDEEALEVLKGLAQVASDDIGTVYTQASCLIRTDDFDLALERLASVAFNDLVAAPFGSEQLVEAVLDLLALCINSSHCWRNHHKNCKIIESVLAKLEVVVKDRQNHEEQYIWRRNLAHIMFMTDRLHETCSQIYNELIATSQRDVVASNREDVVSFANVDATVLGNLCACYILTGRNRDAEQLIKEIESDVSEEQSEDADLSSTLYSAATGTNLTASSFMRTPSTDSSQIADPLVYVNLAVGTLYCVKNNYEFGLLRIIDSLEPLGKKLTTFAWSQVKRCIISLLDKHCRQLIWAQDELLDRVVDFLLKCEKRGILVPANETPAGLPHEGRNSVTYEARHLRATLLAVIHD